MISDDSDTWTESRPTAGTDVMDEHDKHEAFSFPQQSTCQ